MVAKAGVTVWEREIMYKALVQMVLLYGSDIWAVTDATLELLEVFHHRVDHRIAGM